MLPLCQLLECNSSQQSKILQETKLLNDIPVSITPHTTMNFNKGVVRCRDINGMTNEDIIAELHDQGVIDSRRISIKRDGQTIEIIPMFSLSTDFNYQKSLMLDIKLCVLRNTFRLLYNVATVSCMATQQQNADTKLLDVLVVEKITNLMNVNKNQ